MRNTTLRTIGATAVLAGIAIAAVVQMGSGEPSAIEVTPSLDAAIEPVEPAAPDRTTVGVVPLDYRVGLLAGVSTSNFWQYVGDQPTVWNAYVLGPTKPALFGIDPSTNQLMPELAAGSVPSPTWNAEGWRVRVDLGSDLAWSDGTTVTADDVVYTFETVRRLGLSGGWDEAYPATIESIVAESQQRLRIEFTERPSLQVWPYGVGLAPVMPAHIWSGQTDMVADAAALYGLDPSADVSGGPLQVTEVGDTRIESIANPGYPGEGPDTVTYLVYADEHSAVAALESGEIDTIITPNGLSAESIGALQAEQGITIEKSPANSVRYLGFNLSRAPMSDPRFRQAVALLLDREAATELVPDASAAYTMLSEANETWFDETEAGSIAALYTGEVTGRFDKALAALQEAGYAWTTPPAVVDGQLTAGTGLTINGLPPAPVTILTPGDEYDPARSDYTIRIEETLEVMGFDARPVITDFDTVVDLAFSSDQAGARQYDMYVLGWTLGNPALPDYYRWLFASDGAANSTGYSSPAFDSSLSAYEQATSTAIAEAALWDMERLLATDLPYLVLYHPEIVEAYRSDRVRFADHSVLGGIQGRLGGIADLAAAD